MAVVQVSDSPSTNDDHPGLALHWDERGETETPSKRDFSINTFSSLDLRMNRVGYLEPEGI